MSDCFDHEADAWDSLLFGSDEPDEGGYSYYRRKDIKCNKCNSKNVYWVMLSSGKWCLHDKDTQRPHSCGSNKPATKKDKKTIVGWRLVKCCSVCAHYFIGGKCTKHGFDTGRAGYCRDWEQE